MLPPAIAQDGRTELERIFALFPNLRERLTSGGGKLSGGEQQMLAIARILRTGARFLMLDEPTEGLAPVIIQQIGRTIAELKREGFTILLVEQNFRFASTVADRYFVMEHGQIIDAFANTELEREYGQAARVSRGVMTKTLRLALIPARSRKREWRRRSSSLRDARRPDEPDRAGSRGRGESAHDLFGHAIPAQRFTASC